MAENFLDLKTINELTKYSFYIPAYQRGYRWTKQQVVDLLEDIRDFDPKPVENSDDKTWYCLQPIVVKKYNNEDCYEVIDGQQRLTTIYLILHYINRGYVKERQKQIFSIDYETRNNTSAFLNNPEKEDDTNIDFCYISKAYKTIEKWFYEQEQNTNFMINEFESKFRQYTKVIWYETFEDNPISIFTRLNIGKISLTNSELIKALFLNSSNYSKEFNLDRIRLRQIEIAQQWDDIEYRLQNDKFWYFLSNEQKEENRIELIFKLIAKEKDTISDPYATFRYFSNKMKDKDFDIINNTWKDIVSYYQRFNEWYKERDLYHKIGFILQANIASLEQLYELSCKMKKSEFRIKIETLIRERFKRVNLKDLQYSDNDTKANNEIKSILLLYNILTMLQNDQDDSYFPFSSFKKDKWDVEHIASVKDSIPDTKDREKWLQDVYPYIDEEYPDGKNLKNKIKCFTNINNEESFRELFTDIINHFNCKMNGEEDVNGISNLTLLDATTNRSYKNAVFPLKRKTIIDRDKSGIFIPLCTKNVFLKYFSDYPPKISFWTKDDRLKYEEDLIRVLDSYIGEEVSYE